MPIIFIGEARMIGRPLLSLPRANRLTAIYHPAARNHGMPAGKFPCPATLDVAYLQADPEGITAPECRKMDRKRVLQIHIQQKPIAQPVSPACKGRSHRPSATYQDVTDSSLIFCNTILSSRRHTRSLCRPAATGPICVVSRIMLSQTDRAHSFLVGVSCAPPVASRCA